MGRGWVIVVALCSVACAKQAAVAPTPAPESPVVVESEPETAPIENSAEALIAAAEQITRVELCDVETREPLVTLPPATVEKLRAALRDGGIGEGLSSEAAWSMILRIEVEGRREPFIVQFVTTAVRVKPVDPWSLTIADESGQIDWRIQDIQYNYYEIDLDVDFGELLPEAQPDNPENRAPSPSPSQPLD
jgi:hypothetical protein